MRLYLFTLPKLALFAKFVICLLMVVMPEAAPVESSVQLYNQCSEGLVKVSPAGLVYTDRKNDDGFVNMKMRSHNHSASFTIFAVNARKYICLNKRGKLVGRSSIEELRFSCYFREGIENNYHQFVSTGSPPRQIGFLPNGKPLRNPPKKKLETLRAKGCYNFIKVSGVDVGAHNRHISKNSPKITDAAAKEILKYHQKNRPSKMTPSVRHHHKRHRNRTTKML
ncbi:uncharacterized protein LOC106661928 isoform X2 [Cimex lectularius]|uniref:Fibroblast growth factor n=1 Tax=Cimex lectularius TaxID=79782 RepID=A0A8I6TD90_CIMLE|nr:uncharacterized protein LOC106661928 isoform X2 [Cimex lectularius]